jgi:hypothetical protein
MVSLSILVLSILVGMLASWRARQIAVRDSLTDTFFAAVDRLLAQDLPTERTEFLIKLIRVVGQRGSIYHFLTQYRRRVRGHAPAFASDLAPEVRNDFAEALSTGFLIMVLDSFVLSAAIDVLVALRAKAKAIGKSLAFVSFVDHSGTGQRHAHT